MSVIEITEENSFQYEGQVPRNFLNDLGRRYHRGMACEAGSIDTPPTMIFWKIINLEDDNVPTEAEILCFTAEDESEGEELLAAFFQETESDGAERVTFELESLSPTEEKLLSGAGFEITEEESRDIRVTIEELSALGFNQREKYLPDYIKCLSELSDRQFKAGIMECAFHGMYGLSDDLPFLSMTHYDPYISSCIITDDKVNGFILVNKVMSGEFIVELLFCMPPDASRNLLNMMRFSIREAMELCDMDDTVILRRHNKATYELVKRLFPDKKGDGVLKGGKTV
ncbi:MAG: hypothetical protein K6G42_02865 [Lachnospiraceae bacterium]|nr:hypothetical protein [Lachnospiraceae bacterium]